MISNHYKSLKPLLIILLDLNVAFYSRRANICKHIRAYIAYTQAHTSRKHMHTQNRHTHQIFVRAQLQLPVHEYARAHMYILDYITNS